MDYLGEYHPALVISDIVMPQMNGYELCKNIKLNEYTCDIPVILMTSLTGTEDVLESLACGADSFITKPYSESYLLTQIEGFFINKLLHHKESSQGSVEISLANQNRKITIDPQRMVSLILSTYEATIEKQKELIEAQDEVCSINENLENIVKEKTIDLITENEKRKKSEAELVIANKELAFQNEEKDKRAAELVIANKELAFQNEEKEKRASELIEANNYLKKSLISFQRLTDAAIGAITNIVEKRDPYTAGHQQRVSKLACAIAKEMGWDESFIEGIRIAGLLHDIGKIAIPIEILSKPGKLSELEFRLIKLHTKASYDILKDIEFNRPIADMVLQHHERLDGSGYPNGLKGNEISMDARILNVSDVVEAMISYRPYRPALGLDKALIEINEHKGTLYDESVVDTCTRLFTSRSFEF